MLRIYTTPSCSSCRKAKKWMEEYKIDYVEKNMFNTKLTKTDIHNILKYSENGFEDIISTRSKVFKEGNIDLESMTISELVEFIIKNPTVLKRPIIVDERIMQVGYNVDEIRVFLPKELRRKLVCSSCDPDNGDCKYFNDLKTNLES